MSNNRHPVKAMALMSGILSQLVGCILIGIFLGRSLDEKIHSTPLFLVIGLLLGLGIGVYATMKLIKTFSQENTDD